MRGVECWWRTVHIRGCDVIGLRNLRDPFRALPCYTRGPAGARCRQCAGGGGLRWLVSHFAPPCRRELAMQLGVR